MKKSLLIIGASGHGKVVADIALKLHKWSDISFLDDDLSLKTSLDLPVIGTTKDVEKYIEDREIFVAIGNNRIRKKIQDELVYRGGDIATIIDPSAIIGLGVSIGCGTVIMPGAIVNCSTSIGRACIINTGATVDHDNVIKDYVHISPGAHLSGSVIVGENTWLGVGAIVSNNISIGDNCIIGAGGLVIKDLQEMGTYVGVPVRKI